MPICGMIKYRTGLPFVVEILSLKMVYNWKGGQPPLPVISSVKYRTQYNFSRVHMATWHPWSEANICVCRRFQMPQEVIHYTVIHHCIFTGFCSVLGSQIPNRLLGSCILIQLTLIDQCHLLLQPTILATANKSSSNTTSPCMTWSILQSQKHSKAVWLIHHLFIHW